MTEVVAPRPAIDCACEPAPKLRFGNPSLAVHVVRGVLGLSALLGGLWGAVNLGWPALLLLPAGVWLLKGCPMCWTQGLFETLAWRAAARRANPRQDPA